MDNSRFKFRAWHKENEVLVYFMPEKIITDQFVCAALGRLIAGHGGEYLMQWTGLKDKNGVDVYEGDLLNVFYTSNNGEHNHDCIYRVEKDLLGGVRLFFEKLLWEYYGYNQYPNSCELESRYGTLCAELIAGRIAGEAFPRLFIPDSFGENHLLMNKWKCNDKSSYIEVIGNILENTELIKEK